VRIINLNPDTGIGASAWFVEIDGHRVLLDTGTHPKREGLEGMPLSFDMPNNLRTVKETLGK
jgi:predicted metal-dependent RNase